MAWWENLNGMSLAAVITAIGSAAAAIGAIVLGLYNGRNKARMDTEEVLERRERARLDRERAEDDAGRLRVDALAADAADSRARLRELEESFDEKVSFLRRDRDRGWDLARHHFGILSVLIHLWNNVFTVVEIGGDDARISASVRNAQKRVEAIKIPVSLEEPIPAQK